MRPSKQFWTIVGQPFGELSNFLIPQTFQVFFVKLIVKRKSCISGLRDSLIFNINKVTKVFEPCNANNVCMKKLVDFYKAYESYGKIICSMLNAVVHNVSCTTNPCQISFNIFFHLEENVIRSSSFQTTEVGVTIICAKPSKLFFKTILLENQSQVFPEYWSCFTSK